MRSDLRPEWLDAFDHAEVLPSEVTVQCMPTLEEASIKAEYVHAFRLINIWEVEGADPRETAAVMRHELEHVRQLRGERYYARRLLKEYARAYLELYSIRPADQAKRRGNYVRIPMEVSANAAAREFNGVPLGVAGGYIPPGPALLEAMRLWHPSADMDPFNFRPSALGVPA